MSVVVHNTSNHNHVHLIHNENNYKTYHCPSNNSSNVNFNKNNITIKPYNFVEVVNFLNGVYGLFPK